MMGQTCKILFFKIELGVLCTMKPSTASPVVIVCLTLYIVFIATKKLMITRGQGKDFYHLYFKIFSIYAQVNPSTHVT